ncbi:tRNA glutamyl-Q(34) synthetase GluQRS [Propioniciclava sinopodophylli]|uniref:tRNA glutamyl-Q(34) synthetase GluQRS n=1 Tax=Propioniciclava sinopodophylli TaxID=1837344 RepID=A0A4Q9KAM7_9ACTN|nr:tRNA glutamyl-Q(34) synthetase GluQRS [Propioniciclava sinopodophylli]TBT82549.1 tRNA glutamyl-Q(34) synthetase GluQRS [Propioniciclava sinopodophylli]
MAGRFAPSPTSDLHVGNLRTAVVSWLAARHAGVPHLIRVEDLDATRVKAAPEVATRQLADLAAIGVVPDGEVVWQSRRLDLYEAAVNRLPTYECYCTRREIAEAASAPHDDGHRPYPGTCRELSAAARAARRAERPPALRVDARGAVVTVRDRWAGEVTGTVDDFVVRRNDGAHAYNLAVVVDDLEQGVTQVVRGDDLLTSSPRQAWLARALGGTEPEYAHVGLVTNAVGARLAKRDGVVTLADLAGQGWTPGRVLSLIGNSLGLCEADEPVDLDALLARFDPALRPEVWVFPPAR